MQIYIAKPGSQREGPFTLDEINRDLASKKYTHNDYWAWHEGLPRWVPLYEVPGVITKPPAVPTPPAPEPVKAVQETPAVAAPPAAKAPRPDAPAVSAPEIKAAFASPASQPESKKIEVPSPAPREPAQAKAQVSARPAAPVAPQPTAAAITPVKTSDQPNESEKQAAPLELKEKISPPAVSKPEKPILPSPGASVSPALPASAEKPPAAVQSASQNAPVPARPTATPGMPAAPAPSAREPEPPKAASKQELSSGMPFAALEQVFIFSSGEGRTVFASETVARKLQQITGEPLEKLRKTVPVDVVGHANIGVEMMLNHAIPDKAWRAMFSIKPVIAQKAKDDLSQVHARAFTVETNDAVAAIFFYDRSKV